MGGGQMPAEGRFPALNVQDVLFCSRSTEWQNIGQTQRIAILMYKLFMAACSCLTIMFIHNDSPPSNEFK